jgi:excisionase family DNA binding protein
MMTPDHQQVIENTLQLAYARCMEWNNMLSIPQGKNPPKYTHEMLWGSPLAHDLVAIASYVEGYPAAEDITVVVARVARTLFGHTLNQTGFRLPFKFHRTPLGEMMFKAFERYFPPPAWMTTAEVQRLCGVRRQTIYDWAEEGKLAAYYVGGKQVYLRQQVEQFQAARERQRRSRVVAQL